MLVQMPLSHTSPTSHSSTSAEQERQQPQTPLPRAPQLSWTHTGGPRPALRRHWPGRVPTRVPIGAVNGTLLSRSCSHGLHSTCCGTLLKISPISVIFLQTLLSSLKGTCPPGPEN